MTPITIAGETLTEQDWPEGSPNFKRLEVEELEGAKSPEDATRWCFVPDGTWLGCAFGDFYGIHIEGCAGDSVMHIIAAVARCYFLDKAAEESRTLGPQPDRMLAKPHLIIRWKAQQAKMLAYLQSAEKWARIGRAK